MKKLLPVLFFMPTILFSQSRKERKALEVQQKADQQVINALKSHVQYLTELQSSSNPNVASGEEAALKYISTQFQTAGLLPKGTNGFIQPFKIEDGKRIDPQTYLKVNGTLLNVNKEYFPLSYSAEKNVTGMPAMALRERGVPWFADIKDWMEESEKTSAFDINQAIKKETAKLALKGATALFLYNTGTAADGLHFDNKDKSSPLPIPVIYVMPEGYKNYFADHSQLLDIELNVQFKEKTIPANNLIGYINNSAPSEVIISAHYNTRTEEENGKSGADDNRSAIAMLIELAKMLSTSKAKNNNYLFIAFGGSDKGFSGADYWIENEAAASPINYVLDLDMIGSCDNNKRLMIHGFHSSPEWNNILVSASDRKTEVNIDSSAAIGEINSAFYQKEIPVLSLSCAQHEGYSTASDEESKINYTAELQIGKFISRLVEAANSRGRVAFSKLTERPVPTAKAESETSLAPAVPPAAQVSTVSLGIIPEKYNNSDGLRVSSLTPKKLASKIGLQSGDILLYLGPHRISDFKSYMQALSNFKTGDKTTLRIKRGKDDKEFAVDF